MTLREAVDAGGAAEHVLDVESAGLAVPRQVAQTNAQSAQKVAANDATGAQAKQ